MVTRSGLQLADAIKKAIADHEITQAEHEEIVNLAMDDYALDPHEKSLMRELADMIANKSVKRVP
jgi:FixJ family two-component response regulator